MNPATKPSEIDRPGAHLRLVSDRAGARTPGITLSGVSKNLSFARRRRAVAAAAGFSHQPG